VHARKQSDSGLRDWWTRLFDGGHIHGRIQEMRDALESGNELTAEIRAEIVQSLQSFRQLLMLEELRRMKRKGGRRMSVADDHHCAIAAVLVFNYSVNAKAAVRAALGVNPDEDEVDRVYDVFRNWKRRNPGVHFALIGPGYDEILGQAGTRLTEATGAKALDLETAMGKVLNTKLRSPKRPTPSRRKDSRTVAAADMLEAALRKPPVNSKKRNK
jgi:hypothetical protein